MSVAPFHRAQPGDTVAPQPAKAPAGPQARPGLAGRGFAIISAIFLLIVLSLLGAMIVALSSTQQVSQARDILGSRAYFAARAGVEWGLFQVLQNSTCTPSSTLPALAGSAQGFTVTVTCSVNSPAYDEAGTSGVYVYQITSTAIQGTLGALDYVDRQVQAVVSVP